MKKNLIAALAGIMVLFFATSCSKSDPAPQTATVQGKWAGFTAAPVGPSRYIALTFNAGGTLLVEANNSAAPDIANGTWVLAADSVRGIFTYTGSATGTFSMAAKYVANVTTMNGTIGSGIFTSGLSGFSVTKQ